MQTMIANTTDAALLTEKFPAVPTTGPYQDALAHRRLRLLMRELSVSAGLGASLSCLGGALLAAFDDTLASPRNLGAAQRFRLAGELVAGACKAVRWLDPARSACAVPPLCVVLWHVGSSFRQRHRTTLWLDCVMPDDTRRKAAIEWAHDLRRLLTSAGVPHVVETVLVGSTAHPAELHSQPVPKLSMWGCESLFHQYLISGETLRGPIG
jgi:hypothetical protein